MAGELVIAAKSNLKGSAAWHARAVPIIDADQRKRECDSLMDAAVVARHDHEARIEALRECVAHPCAYHELDLPELYGTLGETLDVLHRYDESLEAWEAAIAAGYRGVPHPRTNVAEVLLRAGRREEADAVFADLHRQCPDDIWLYNSAGLSYREVGEHEAALPWLDEGIAIALADGDAEGILFQLDAERTRCREGLGLDKDALTDRVAAFERPGPSRGISTVKMLGEAQPDRSPCTHCGWYPENDRATSMRLDELEWLADTLHGDAAGALFSDRHMPIRAVKVGRNAPCPCQSGRKFKNCCGP